MANHNPQTFSDMPHKTISMTGLAVLLCIIISQRLEAAPQPSPTDDDKSFLREVIYTPEDSARVISLLGMEVEGDTTLFYARKFVGTPYVGHTLEIHEPEFLVVNLHELDCLTLVETVCALAMTKREGKTGFADYCRNLERLRYQNGQRRGYLSRLHYFPWWEKDNGLRKIITDVQQPDYFTTPMMVGNNYMSTHPDKYEMLRRHPDWASRIKMLEGLYNGRHRNYMPTDNVKLKRKVLTCIHDGDIIGIVQLANGIDVSHLGFAFWGKDGQLHMLHASSLQKKVIEDTTPLYQYLIKQKKKGIKVLRLR